MIQIDGSTGEGGGQVLRTALGLSLVTGQPFQMKNIRAGRKKPGLLRQHLTAVRAATEIGGAEALGAEVNSMELTFTPGTLTPGSYHYSIGTAGSCTLVFQAILPALLQMGAPSEITLEGGTHNPMAPPFDFLQRSFLPLLQQMGPQVKITLERPGFFPAGGGKITLGVEPTAPLKPLEIISFSNVEMSARALCAQLPGHIGQRELKVLQRKLALDETQCELVQLDRFGPGNTVSIFVKSEQVTETFTGFGQRNVSAEKVATTVAKETRKYLENQAPVGPYLADQLLIPMALAGSGRFLTGKPTSHTITNMEIIKNFITANFTMTQVSEWVWEIRL